MDRALFDPREVVDRDGLAVHLDAEVLAGQVRDGPSARVRDHDVEVHDADFDRFPEGREALVLRRRHRRQDRQENRQNRSHFVYHLSMRTRPTACGFRI